MSNLEIIKACESSLTMSEAASKTGLHFNTFKKLALKLGVYRPNQGAKGTKKSMIGKTYPMHDILNGKFPYYSTHKLRVRLIKEGIKEEKCECCGLKDWNNNKISFELNHKDGNRTNHKLENLEILCPNCHSQTTTYRGKKNKRC